ADEYAEDQDQGPADGQEASPALGGPWQDDVLVVLGLVRIERRRPTRRSAGVPGSSVGGPVDVRRRAPRPGRRSLRPARDAGHAGARPATGRCGAAGSRPGSGRRGPSPDDRRDLGGVELVWWV